MWAAIAVGLAAVALGLASEAIAFDWDETWRWAPDLLAGWTLVGAGLVAWRGQRGAAVGGLLTASGFLWFLGFWPVAVFWHRGPLVHLLLTYPGWRPRSRLDAAAVILGYVAALLPVLWGSDPVAFALVSGLVIVALRGFATARPGDRAARRVALEVTLLLAAIILGGAVARWVTPGREAVLPALLAYEAALIAAAMMLVIRSPHRSAGAVADLVVLLDEQESGDLRDRLASALGDPTLQVGFWSPTAAAYLTDDGTAVEQPPERSGRSATRIDRAGQRFVLLVHDDETLRDPALLEAVTGATALVDSQVVLRQEVQAQVEQVVRSRRRLMVAGDEERARLAARLAHGPQRRLDAISHALGELSGGTGDAHRARALEHVRLASAELGSLADGLHPQELEEDGLAGALRLIAGRTPLPVDVDVDVPDLPDTVQVAAYFVVSEALANVAKHARAGRARVGAHVTHGVLLVEVDDDGVGAAAPAGSGLLGLADRVSALGGSLEVASPAGGGTRITARIPVVEPTG